MAQELHPLRGAGSAPVGRTQGNRYPIHSTHPKVWLAIGNCLIGHIPDRQCMALAMMHSVGVYQMVGYTMVTDNFILVPLHQGLEPMKGNQGEVFPIQGDYQKRQTFTVVFATDRI